MKNKTDLYIAATQRALQDFEYFAERCVFIRNKLGEVVPLKLNNVQRSIIKEVAAQERAGKPVRIIILKARQMGVSTVIQAYILWRMLRGNNVNAVELAHEKEAARAILDINRFAIRNLPGWFRAVKQVKEEYFTKYEISLAGIGSSLTVTSSEGKEPGRSRTIHVAHLSECAFYEDAEKISRALFAAIPKTPNTVIFIESTGNGPAGLFYNMFTRSWKAQQAGRELAYKALFYPWYVHDEYQMPVPDGVVVECPPELEHLHLSKERLYWRQWVIENEFEGDDDAFKLEYPATVEEAFLRKDSNLFRPEAVLKRLQEVENIPYQDGFLTRKTMDSPIEFVPQSGERFRVFKPPEAGRMYVIGADTGSGVVVNRVGDFSSADVLDAVTGEQVAHLHMLAEPTSYAQDLFLLGTWYNNAMIAVEVTDGHGLSAVNWLRDNGYYSLYQRRVYDKLTNQWVGKLGWSTTKKTKKFIVDNLRSDFYNSLVIINNKETLQEMSTFVRLSDKSDEIGAVSGAKDDRVMSLAIANQIRREVSAVAAAQAQQQQQQQQALQNTPEEVGQPIPLAALIRQQYAQRQEHPILGRYA
ncbi:hypothetical protein [Gelria sp. Kuro-4]|uniref:hypothetical protein n=1 Tax=Gelria sp. Kuro-4 TaxID=2796927 RepID=UPI001C819C90|nr:hypothetical protein [Gelria sp. Kuro-4]